MCKTAAVATDNVPACRFLNPNGFLVLTPFILPLKSILLRLLAKLCSLYLWPLSLFARLGFAISRSRRQTTPPFSSSYFSPYVINVMKLYLLLQILIDLNIQRRGIFYSVLTTVSTTI